MNGLAGAFDARYPIAKGQAMGRHLAALGGSKACDVEFPTWPTFGREEENALAVVLRSGHWGRLGGEQVDEFERRFAALCGCRHAVAVTSGTTALRIALLACGLRAGDEVIVPPYTFLATASAVVECNATCVFADIEAETFNLDPAAAAAAVTPRTRAIVAVHLGGLPAEMDAINAIAARHGLTVIEDAAHAHGAEYKGRRAGCLSAMGCFSFQASKNLTAGEGGAITTNDDRLASVCRSIHNCGRVEGGAWYEHEIIGGNHRMTEFQAAVLNCQLARLDEQCARRDRNGRYLAERLADVPGLDAQKRGDHVTRHAHHLFCMRYDQSAFGAPREVFLEALRAEGVPISAGYVVPLYRQPLFAKRGFGPYTACVDARPELDYAALRLPVAERVCTAEGCWLGQNVLLADREAMDAIVAAARKLCDHRDELAELAAARRAPARG